MAKIIAEGKTFEVDEGTNLREALLAQDSVALKENRLCYVVRHFPSVDRDLRLKIKPHCLGN